MTRRVVRLGSRGSRLAVIQAESVRDQLADRFPEVEFEMVKVSTTGDRNPGASLEQLGGEGVFVKELEEALLQREIDIAVHSLKDMLTTVPEGLRLVAVPRRADPRDVLVSSAGGVKDLPKRARVGTGSPRRAVQLLALRPDLEIRGLRGNIDTRLKKAFSGELDGVIMAAAALERLGRSDQIAEYLAVEDFVPAVGQGALGVEIRAGEVEIMEMLAPLNHRPSWQSVTAERVFLKALGGGCRAPIAAFGMVEKGLLHLQGMVAAPDGSAIMKADLKGDALEAEVVGQRLAEEMAGRGARDLIERERT